MKYGNIVFSGKSGEDYRFEAWPLGTRFRSVPGVYFVTRREVEDTNYHRACHENIYIGQTASLAEPLGTPPLIERFSKHGANCICVCAIDSEERRKAIEKDLLAAYPTLCNQAGNPHLLWFDLSASRNADGVAPKL